jgi:hypothetical protein
MNNDFTLGVCGAIEPNITFLTNASKEVMRIDNNGVTINPEIPLDEAAQHVINALDAHIQHIVRSEREACAQMADSMDSLQDGAIGKAIRARGNT